jgi:ascorbate-specific PTS system EIIC-type component UlaA
LPTNNKFCLSLEVLTKSGAIVSSAGIALLIAFVVVLLVFPVNKKCEAGETCSYISTAPVQLAAIVHPVYLAVTLMIIAAGVFMVRVGRWKNDKKTKGGS